MENSWLEKNSLAFVKAAINGDTEVCKQLADSCDIDPTINDCEAIRVAFAWSRMLFVLWMLDRFPEHREQMLAAIKTVEIDPDLP